MLSINRVFKTWWPLATSWLLMGVELPALTAIVARLPNSEINLAAYGGIIYPLALIIESPIIMLLAASTALSKDWDSYIKVRRFMHLTSAIMTGLHILIAFTPLYDFIARQLLGAPLEIIEPGRLGLRIMLPWTWSIAFRRFHQGVLIRFDRAETVSAGTLIRILTNGMVLTIGYLSKNIPGIVVATSAVITGVICEAVYIGIVVRPVLSYRLRLAHRIDPPLTFPAFFDFYLPLVLTSLLDLLVQPIGSATLSRMPQALESLAAWPVITGLTFMLRSLGIAYNEVVVSLLDQPKSSASLQRFTFLLVGGNTVLLLLFAVTPLSGVWFSTISGLSPELTRLARIGLWLTIPTPAFSVLQSWYRGALLHSRRTRAISQAVIIFLSTSTILLVLGAIWGKTTGLYIGLAAFTLAGLIQTIWLGLTSRPSIEAVRQRDAELEGILVRSEL